MPHREKLIKNFTYLEEVSHASCKLLEAMVPNFKDISMNDMSKESDSDAMYLTKISLLGGEITEEVPRMAGLVLFKHAFQAACEALGIIEPAEVFNNMLLHAAAKCRLAGRALCLVLALGTAVRNVGLRSGDDYIASICRKRRGVRHCQLCPAGLHEGRGHWLHCQG